MMAPGKKFFVTSEKSNELTEFLNVLNYKSIYYFFHAVAANEWYRNYRYYPPKFDNQLTHTFISYNNLATKYRGHRVDLLARLYDKNLIKQGLVSFNSPNLQTLEQATELLSDASLDIFNRQKHNLTTPLTIDQTNVHGSLSASIDLENSRNSFVQIVTETVFYQDKIHLTEKVFKPIVAGQPFLLLAAPNNLKYLKSYGFKTFGDYWDESYDSILDPTERMSAVVKIVEDLSNMSLQQLTNIRNDMREILAYNYNHFYNDLRAIAVSEFVNNLETALKQESIEYSTQDLRELYNILAH